MVLGQPGGVEADVLGEPDQVGGLFIDLADGFADVALGHEREDAEFHVGSSWNGIDAATGARRRKTSIKRLSRSVPKAVLTWFGAKRTQELTLPGFQHDIGAMDLGLFAGSPFWQEHREALEAKGVSFVAADHSAGSVFPDGRFLGVTTDPEENKRAITGFSKADAEAWETWLSDFDACAPHLFALLGSRAVPASATALRFGEDQDVPDAVAPVLRGILADSLRANLTARFESPELQAMIAAWGLHPDTAPDIAGGCTYPFIETNIDARQGIAIATGGSGTVMMALVALIEEAGGEVRCDTTVDRIIIEDNRAVGVELASGEAHYASRAVLASVTPQALLNLTGNHLPAAETQRAQTWRHGPGTMMIHLALSDLPDWQAEGARKSFYVHIGPSLDDLARAYQEGV